MIKKTIVIVAIILLSGKIIISDVLDTYNQSNIQRKDAMPVIVSKENPFYAIIAAPVALYYDDSLHVQPLLVENVSNPSRAIQRFKEAYGLKNAITISNKDIVQASIELAMQIWERSDEAIIIKNDFEGYKLGVVLATLACYKGIPIFVVNDVNEIEDALYSLNVKKTYVCGNVSGYGEVTRFETVEEINDYLIDFLKEKFGGVNYIVMTNPLDTKKPEVLDSVEYEFIDKTNSVAILPAQSFHVLLTQQFYKLHEFEIPYTYARVKIDLINLDSQNAKELGDEIFLMIMNPDGKPYVYTATGAGIPEMENGDILQDRVHFEFIVCNEPGKYTARVIGRWFANVEGKYKLKIKVEKINTPIDPLMENLSSLAPYVAAYHKGIVFANTSFAFAGTKGMSQPGDNPEIIDECNQHVLNIHKKLLELLSKIADIPSHNKYYLWKHYKENPIYIAILGDTTMIPMFYYKNPDSGYILGWGVPGDFIYGDIDINMADLENDTYTYYPFQENAVGRITGYDAEDASALIARTFFYNYLLGEWKKNATIQTGAGLEFQWIPILTTIANLLLGTNEPTKWPSGESYFINLRLCNDLEKAGFNVKRTHLLASQREGFENLKKYGRRFFLFPRFYEMISGDNVKGGKYQEESNIIFAFNHGFYYLYESGDILLDARGFPPFTTLSRFYPMGSGLSTKGSYDVRNVYSMELNPSVVFIESCIVGRTDGLIPENCLSQAYIHAGANAFIAASRVTADPGYLEPGLIFEGFGIYGFINATLNLKLHNKYPDPHFGAVIAEDFILDLIQNDSTVGMALRNAKNKYLPKDANSTFLWTPPLISTGCKIIDDYIYSNLYSNPRFEYGKYLVKKYHCLHEFNLYGDPAFNPWNP